MKIYKYKLDFKLHPEKTIIELHKGAVFLEAAFINEEFFAWFEVDPDAETGRIGFQFAATGQDLGNHEMKTHLKTMVCGDFVWHLYALAEIVSPQKPLLRVIA